MAGISDRTSEAQAPQGVVPIDWDIDLSRVRSVKALQPDNLIACDTCGKEKQVKYMTASDVLPQGVKAADVTVNNSKGDANQKKVILFNIDLSGSMQSPISGGDAGQTKIEIALLALQRALTNLPMGTYVGVRIFGPNTGFADSPNACAQTAVIVPVQEIKPGSRTEIVETVRKYSPDGVTPLTESMEKLETNELHDVEKKLGSNADITEVLISDGGESCGRNACDYWKGCHQRHPKLKLRIIGLDLTDPQARIQFECMEENGRKDKSVKYKDAADVNTLTDAILDSAEVYAELYRPQQQPIAPAAPVSPYGVRF